VTWRATSLASDVAGHATFKPPRQLDESPILCYFPPSSECFSDIHNLQGERTLKPENIYNGGILDALRPIGSINDLTDEELKRMRAVRIHDPITRTSIVIPSKDYGGLYAHCVATLQNCEGYIFAHDLNRIRGLMARRNVISHDELTDIRRRANGLRNVGIPPIFTEEWCARTTFRYTVRDGIENGQTEVSFDCLFPVIDFLIQYGAGVYERRRAGMAVTLGRAKCKGNKIPLTPASSEDVLLFRRFAFMPNGRIDPLLMMEVLEYVSTHFQFHTQERCEDVLEFDLLAFTFLESELQDLPLKHPTCEHRGYEDWDGDPLVVHERRWYLRFAPDTRIRIVQTYLDGLKGTLRGKDAKTFRFLQQAFPQQTLGMHQKMDMRQKELERAQLEEWIKNAFAQSDFRNPPSALLMLPEWNAEFLPRIKEGFRNTCQSLDASDPGALFENVEYLAATLKVPKNLAYLPEFKRILDEERLEAARHLSDERFQLIFTDARKIIGIGHSKFREESQAARALRAYLLERYRSLRAA